MSTNLSLYPGQPFRWLLRAIENISLKPPRRLIIFMFSFGCLPCTYVVKQSTEEADIDLFCCFFMVIVFISSYMELTYFFSSVTVFLISAKDYLTHHFLWCFVRQISLRTSPFFSLQKSAFSIMILYWQSLPTKDSLTMINVNSEVPTEIYRDLITTDGRKQNGQLRYFYYDCWWNNDLII